MQARNLLLEAAAPVLDDDVDGFELVLEPPDDPQAAASRVITPTSATIRIFALKMYLLCPRRPAGAGWTAGSIAGPRRLGQGKSVPDPPGIARRLVRCRLAGKPATAVLAALL
jgi:hypothetical protein